MVLSLLVSIRFQVLFHSPPGVLFTVPSRYCTLSVTWSYLALRDGPRIFRQDSSCPAVLWIPTALESFRVRAFYPVSSSFPTVFHYNSPFLIGSFTPNILLSSVWAPPISLATTFGIVNYFLFLRVIRCFSSPGSPYYTMDSCNNNITLLMLSSLIRKSTDHGIFASPRSLSQLVTSFFGAMYQGIHLYALRSLIFRCFRIRRIDLYS